MREQLIKYVELLFAGSPNTYDVQQEILQNTLDRYDDLIQQGKQPEAAYRLAISGIGDINEILGSSAKASAVEAAPAAAPGNPVQSRTAPVWKKIVRAVAIFLYIISIIPLFVLSELGMDTIGLCGTIAIVAVATVLIILSSAGKSAEPAPQNTDAGAPQDELYKAIKSIIGIVCVCIYLAISFATGAWWITWLVFPIMASIQGLVKAIIDLKEASKHEK